MYKAILLTLPAIARSIFVPDVYAPKWLHPRQASQHAVKAAGLWITQRPIECPVCTEEQKAKCDWTSILGSSMDGSCQLPKTTYTCDCCPRCLSKLGEVCGYDTSDEIYSCEEHLFCSRATGLGVCVSEPAQVEKFKSDLYADDEKFIEDLYEDYPSDEPNMGTDDLTGCGAHRSSLFNIALRYPHIPGRTRWTPRCEDNDEQLYHPVQCLESKHEKSRRFNCWCVDPRSGAPTIHMTWDSRSIDTELCEKIALDLKMAT